jgi:AraC-like DNA-binding protein
MNNGLHHIKNWLELAHEAKWCAATLAKNCGVSLRTLERHFLKEMGKCPKAWLSEQRQQQGRQTLAERCQCQRNGGMPELQASESFDQCIQKTMGKLSHG